MATMTDARARFEALRRKAAAGPGGSKASGDNGLLRRHPAHDKDKTPFAGPTTEETSKRDLTGSVSDHGPRVRSEKVPESCLLSGTEHNSRATGADQSVYEDGSSSGSVKSSRAAFLERSPFHRMEFKPELEISDKPADEKRDSGKLLVNNQRRPSAKRSPFHQTEAQSSTGADTKASLQKDEDDHSYSADNCYFPVKNKKSALLQRSPFHRMDSESSLRSGSSTHSKAGRKVKAKGSLQKDADESSDSTDNSRHSVCSKRSAFLQRSPFHRMDSEASLRSKGSDKAETGDSAPSRKYDKAKLSLNNQNMLYANRSPFHAMEAKRATHVQAKAISQRPVTQNAPFMEKKALGHHLTTKESPKTTERKPKKEDGVGASLSDHGPSRSSASHPSSSLLSNTVHTCRAQTEFKTKNSRNGENPAFDELRAKLKRRSEIVSPEQESGVSLTMKTTEASENPSLVNGRPTALQHSPFHRIMESRSKISSESKSSTKAETGLSLDAVIVVDSKSSQRSSYLQNSSFHNDESRTGPSSRVHEGSLQNPDWKPGNVGIVVEKDVPPKSAAKLPFQGSSAGSMGRVQSPSWIRARNDKLNGTSIDDTQKVQSPSSLEVATGSRVGSYRVPGDAEGDFTEQTLTDEEIVENREADIREEEVNEIFEEDNDSAGGETEVEEITEFEEEEAISVEEEEVTEFEEEEITEISYEEEECVLVEEPAIDTHFKKQQLQKQPVLVGKSNTRSESLAQEALQTHSAHALTQTPSEFLSPPTRDRDPLTAVTCHVARPSREVARHKSGPETFKGYSSSYHSPRQSPRNVTRQKSGPETFEGLPAGPVTPPVPVMQVSRKIRQVTKTLEFNSMLSKDDAVKLFNEIQRLIEGNETKQREFGIGKGIAGFVSVLKKYQEHAAVLESGFPVIAELANIESNRDALALQGCIEFVLIAMLANENGLIIQERGCNAIASLAKTPKYQEWIVASNGIEVIITIQSAFKSNVTIQTACLRAMHNLARDNKENTFSITAKGGVRSLMEVVKLPEHSNVLEFQMEACAAMATLARTNDSNRGSIAAAGGLDVTVKAMKTFPRDEGFLSVAFDTLFCLATEHSQNTDTIVANRGVETLIQSMKIYESNLPLQEAAIRLARLLTDREATSKKFVAAGGMKVVMSSMRHFEESHLIQDDGCSTILNMARQPENKETICGTGGIGIIVMAMKKLRDSSLVQKTGCKALECLATSDQNKKSIAAGGGVNAILVAMKKHSGVPALQGLAVSALKKLASIGRNRNAMNAANCIETVERVMESYPTNTFLHNNGKALLLLLDPSRAEDVD